MQNQSAHPSISTPRRLQAVAALLPEEIVDSIFAQFGFEHSMAAPTHERVEQGRILTNMSVVAEGWMKPARRLLFRTVKIKTWEHLQEAIDAWVGQQVWELEVDTRSCAGRESGEVASALFKVLKKLSNLRRLRLPALRCESFTSTDSASMQSTVFLPNLYDLFISQVYSPHSIISDLLATSNGRISQLTVVKDYYAVDTYTPHSPLDFRGKIRCLEVEDMFYRTLFDSTRFVLGSLEGLTELKIYSVEVESSPGEEELYQVIAPTLSTLSIDGPEVERFAEILPVLSRLSRLSITNPEVNPAPLLHILPPSICFLGLGLDEFLQPILARWTAKPSLVPAGLKHIQIDQIQYADTFKQLPRLELLSVPFSYNLVPFKILEQLSRGDLMCTTLELAVGQFVPEIKAMQRECLRLGVNFRAMER